MVEAFEGTSLKDMGSLFIAWNAQITGDVVLGKETSVWYSATMRGDVASIRIGNRTNIQDNAVCHTSHGYPLTVGHGVTVGHGAILHGCTIEDNSLIGMGAIILDGAVIRRDSIVGAGTLVTKGVKFPPRSLIMGNPARLVKELTEEQIESIRVNADDYVGNSRQAAASSPGASRNFRFR